MTRLVSGGIAALVALSLAASLALPVPASAGTGQPSCGAPIAKRGDGDWRCTFVDRFGGDGLNLSKWVAQRTATSGYTSGPTACFVNSPDNISVSDGTLKLTAREESEPFTCRNPYGDFETRYTSGMVSTAEGRFSQAYGRFEFRARVSAVKTPGLHSALWLWPADARRYGSYPASGEIDVAELYSAYPDRAIPYIHYDLAGPDPTVTNTSCMIRNPSAFHTYSLEWTSERLKVVYDGRKCLAHRWHAASPLTGQQPFDQPFYVVLTQALGVGTNAFDPGRTPLPATTEVDWVRVWK
jgi:beta-glucanase (GH16 family)